MSITAGAVASVPPIAAGADPVVTAASDHATPPAGAAGRSSPDVQSSAITPLPIQPLSNRVLATFMQKDIELYGALYGA